MGDSDSGLYVARVNASIIWQGRRVPIRRGKTTARAGHPILESHATMFEPLRVDYELVEQATARPGERRDTQAPDTKAIREWAAANGFEVPARGLLPEDVVAAYKKAHEG